METKLVAAEIATEAGVSTIITSSQNPENILKIIEYYGTATSDRSKMTSIVRPPHTIFKPSLTPLRDVKSWTSHTLSPAGTVVIDTGAHHTLSRRESGGRLLPAGVIGVSGSFASHQAVRICIWRNVGGEGNGVVNAEKASIDYFRWPAATQPSSLALLSRSSSHVDLGPLPEFAEDVQGSESGLVEDNLVVIEWDLEEVGRGLANYNSAQIDKVKGLNRCLLFSYLD
jgi:glutamate 5-kinase